MNGYAILPLCGFLCNSALAAFVLASNPRARNNQLYALLVAALAFWSLVKFARLLIDDAAAAAMLFAVSAPGWCMLPSLYVAFVLAYTRCAPSARARALLWAAHGLGACFVALAFVPGAMITAMVREPWGYTHVPGPAYRIFGAYLVALFSLGLALLWRARRRASPAARPHYNALIGGILVPLVGGIVTNMALPMSGVHVVELGEVLSTLHAAVVGWAMSRHGLLSVTVEQAADAILATMGDPLIVVDRHGDIVLGNPAAAEILAVSHSSLAGCEARAFVRSAAIDPRSPALVREAEGELVPVNGAPIPVMLSARPIYADGEQVRGSVIVAKDVRTLRQALTDLGATVERLERQAVTDALTGLYNRHEGERRLGDALRVGQRYHKSFAVGLVDLDDLKRINDHHGHPVGDRALCAVAHAAQRALRGSDVVARWGGDEFLVILHDADAVQARGIGERIVDGVRRAAVDGVDAPLGVSLGLAVWDPQTTTCPDELVDRADRALYAAKQAGKARMVVDAPAG